jgi:hypothetical protein
VDQCPKPIDPGFAQHSILPIILFLDLDPRWHINASQPSSNPLCVLYWQALRLLDTMAGAEGRAPPVRYLLKFAHVHFQHRYPELDSVLHILGMTPHDVYDP